MWLVVLALVSGALVGVISRPSKAVGAMNGWLARIGLTLLLVNMGAKLASDPQIRVNMGHTGVSAVVLALSSIAGSVLFVHVLACLGQTRRSKERQRPRGSGVGCSNPRRGEML